MIIYISKKVIIKWQSFVNEITEHYCVHMLGNCFANFHLEIEWFVEKTLFASLYFGFQSAKAKKTVHSWGD